MYAIRSYYGIVSSLRYGDSTLSALEVVRREALDSGAELITLLDGRQVDSEGIDALMPRQYLLQRRQSYNFV